MSAALRYGEDPPRAIPDSPGQARWLLAEGHDPYPVAVERTHTLAQVRAAYPDLAIDTATR